MRRIKRTTAIVTMTVMAVYIHPSLSPIGKAEALSHELYGHGLLYNQYRSRSVSGHDYIKSRDNNDLLRSYIRRTRMETISYFKLNIE